MGAATWRVPICDSYEARLMELIGALTRTDVECVQEIADVIVTAASPSAIKNDSSAILLRGFFSAAVLVSRLLENSQEGIHHHLAASR